MAAALDRLTAHMAAARSRQETAPPRHFGSSSCSSSVARESLRLALAEADMACEERPALYSVFPDRHGCNTSSKSRHSALARVRERQACRRQHDTDLDELPLRAEMPLGGKTWASTSSTGACFEDWPETANVVPSSKTLGGLNSLHQLDFKQLQEVIRRELEASEADMEYQGDLDSEPRSAHGSRPPRPLSPPRAVAPTPPEQLAKEPVRRQTALDEEARTAAPDLRPTRPAPSSKGRSVIAALRQVRGDEERRLQRVSEVQAEAERAFARTARCSSTLLQNQQPEIATVTQSETLEPLRSEDRQAELVLQQRREQRCAARCSAHSSVETSRSDGDMTCARTSEADQQQTALHSAHVVLPATAGNSQDVANRRPASEEKRPKDSQTIDTHHSLSPIPSRERTAWPLAGSMLKPLISWEALLLGEEEGEDSREDVCREVDIKGQEVSWGVPDELLKRASTASTFSSAREGEEAGEAEQGDREDVCNESAAHKPYRDNMSGKPFGNSYDAGNDLRDGRLSVASTASTLCTTRSASSSPPCDTSPVSQFCEDKRFGEDHARAESEIRSTVARAVVAAPSEEARQGPTTPELCTNAAAAVESEVMTHGHVPEELSTTAAVAVAAEKVVITQLRATAELSTTSCSASEGCCKHALAMQESSETHGEASAVTKADVPVSHQTSVSGDEETPVSSRTRFAESEMSRPKAAYAASHQPVDELVNTPEREKDCQDRAQIAEAPRKTSTSSPVFFSDRVESATIVAAEAPQTGSTCVLAKERSPKNSQVNLLQLAASVPEAPSGITLPSLDKLLSPVSEPLGNCQDHLNVQMFEKALTTPEASAGRKESVTIIASQASMIGSKCFSSKQQSPKTSPESTLCSEDTPALNMSEPARSSPRAEGPTPEELALTALHRRQAARLAARGQVVVVSEQPLRRVAAPSEGSRQAVALSKHHPVNEVLEEIPSPAATLNLCPAVADYADGGKPPIFSAACRANVETNRKEQYSHQRMSLAEDISADTQPSPASHATETRCPAAAGKSCEEDVAAETHHAAASGTGEICPSPRNKGVELVAAVEVQHVAQFAVEAGLAEPCAVVCGTEEICPSLRCTDEKKLTTVEVMPEAQLASETRLDALCAAVIEENSASLRGTDDENIARVNIQPQTQPEVEARLSTLCAAVSGTGNIYPSLRGTSDANAGTIEVQPGAQLGVEARPGALCAAMCGTGECGPSLRGMSDEEVAIVEVQPGDRHDVEARLVALCAAVSGTEECCPSLGGICDEDIAAKETQPAALLASETRLAALSAAACGTKESCMGAGDREFAAVEAQPCAVLSETNAGMDCDQLVAMVASLAEEPLTEEFTPTEAASETIKANSPEHPSRPTTRRGSRSEVSREDTDSGRGPIDSIGLPVPVGGDISSMPPCDAEFVLGVNNSGSIESFGLNQDDSYSSMELLKEALMLQEPGERELWDQTLESHDLYVILEEDLDWHRLEEQPSSMPSVGAVTPRAEDQTESRRSADGDTRGNLSSKYNALTPAQEHPCAESSNSAQLEKPGDIAAEVAPVADEVEPPRKLLGRIDEHRVPTPEVANVGSATISETSESAAEDASCAAPHSEAALPSVAWETVTAEMEPSRPVMTADLATSGTVKVCETAGPFQQASRPGGGQRVGRRLVAAETCQPPTQDGMQPDAATLTPREAAVRNAAQSLAVLRAQVRRTSESTSAVRLQAAWRGCMCRQRLRGSSFAAHEAVVAPPAHSSTSAAKRRPPIARRSVRSCTPQQTTRPPKERGPSEEDVAEESGDLKQRRRPSTSEEARRLAKQRVRNARASATPCGELQPLEPSAPAAASRSSSGRRHTVAELLKQAESRDGLPRLPTTPRTECTPAPRSARIALRTASAGRATSTPPGDARCDGDSQRGWPCRPSGSSGGSARRAASANLGSAKLPQAVMPRAPAASPRRRSWG